MRPIIVGLLICCCVDLIAQGNSDPRPNILFIVTDDQASWAMGRAAGRRASATYPRQ